MRIPSLTTKGSVPILSSPISACSAPNATSEHKVQKVSKGRPSRRSPLWEKIQAVFSPCGGFGNGQHILDRKNLLQNKQLTQLSNYISYLAIRATPFKKNIEQYQDVAALFQKVI